MSSRRATNANPTTGRAQRHRQTGHFKRVVESLRLGLGATPKRFDGALEVTVIHATKWALAIVGDCEIVLGSAGKRACDGQPLTKLDLKAFTNSEAHTFKHKGASLHWPTCPHCLVLLDQALEKGGR